MTGRYSSCFTEVENLSRSVRASSRSFEAMLLRRLESHRIAALPGRATAGRAFSNTHLMRQFEPEYVSFSTGLRNLIVGAKSLCPIIA